MKSTVAPKDERRLVADSLRNIVDEVYRRYEKEEPDSLLLFTLSSIEQELERLTEKDQPADWLERDTDRVVALVLETASRKTGLPVNDILYGGTARKYYIPRQACQLALRWLTTLTLEEIGRLTGGRHYTTVICNINTAYRCKKRCALASEITREVKTILGDKNECKEKEPNGCN